MVLKSISKIQAKLPGLLHVVMFYSNGIVFNSTFDQTQNIPGIGEKLADIMTQFGELIRLHDNQAKPFKKILYETEKYLIVILKLGEDSYIALLLDNQITNEFKIEPIQNYLAKLEEIVDMDQSEIE